MAVYAYSLQLYFDFLGLHRHRPRHAHSLPASASPINFDLPLPEQLTSPSSAPLAHQFLQLAARLSLLRAASGKRTQTHAPSQSGDHHGAGRPVARLHLELRDLGAAARRGACHHTLAPGAPRTCAPARESLAPRLRGLRHLSVRLLHLDLFPRRQCRSSAFEILGRIASLTASFENVTARLRRHHVAGAATFFAAGKAGTSRRFERFAACPFYVHAGSPGRCGRQRLRYFSAPSGGCSLRLFEVLTCATSHTSTAPGRPHPGDRALDLGTRPATRNGAQSGMPLPSSRRNSRHSVALARHIVREPSWPGW